MTYEEIVGLLSKRFGNRPSLDQSIGYEMVYVQENVIEKEPSFHPWFLLQEDLDVIAFTSGDEYVTLPSDYLALYEYGSVYVYDSAGDLVRTPLEEWTYDKLTTRGTDEDEALVTGQPEKYVLMGNRIYLTPVPNYNGNLGIRMYAKQTAITSETDATTHPILLHASDWLMNAVGLRLAMNVQNTDWMEIFLSQAADARSRIEYETYQREAGSEGRVKGGEL